MAPGITSPVPGNLSSSFYSKLPGKSSQVSAMSGFFDSDSISNNGLSRSGTARRESEMPLNLYATGSSKLSNVIQSLHQQGGDELRQGTSSVLFTTDYFSILE